LNFPFKESIIPSQKMNTRLLWFLFGVCSLWGEKTDLLFHLHDAGETYALLPVIRQLEVDYLVLTTGVAEKLVGEIPKERLRTWSDLESIEPKKVITGVAHERQGEVLDFFSKRQVPTIAYWDNFNAEGQSPYFTTAHAVERRADLLLLPCEALVAAFPERPTRVVGHPTLDVKEAAKIALWIGGYGKDYEEAFQLFKEGMATVQNMAVLIQHHPKTGLRNDLKLSEALSIADLVICHQSTAAFQALAAGTPVLHVIPPGQSFDSLPLQKGLAKKVSSVEDFARGVQEAMDTEVSGFFELMGIPENGTESCKSAILEGLLPD